MKSIFARVSAGRFYKIWSNEHQGWWGPHSSGYVEKRSEAGIYSFAKATSIVRDANIGLKDIPNEAMVEVQEGESFEE